MSKSAEQELKDTSNLFQAVFDSAPNGIAVMQAIYDADGKVEDFAILLFNAYTLNWIGNTEYKGKRYGDVFPMVKKTKILKNFIVVAETGVMANFEQWYNGEGMNHWFRFTAVKQGELLVVTTEDITAAKRAEEALQKSEEFNRTALESSPDCVKVLDTGGHLTYMNYNGTCVMEIDDFDAVKGKSWWDLWPDDSKGKVRDAVRVALTGQTTQFQAFCPTAKGTPKWWDVVVSPINSVDGSVSQLISVSRDITERRKAESALKKSEQDLLNLVLEAPIGICVVEAATLISEIANDAFIRIAGKPAEAIVGKHFWTTFSEVAPYYETAMQGVIDKGEPFYANEVPMMLIRHGQEETVYVTFVYEPMKKGDGTVNKIVVWVIDNTEQVKARRMVQESEQRFQNLVRDATPGIVVLTGEALKVEIVNEGYGRLINLSPDELIGKALFDVIPEAAEYYRPLINKVIQTGEPVYLYDSPYSVTTNGKKIEGFLDVVYQPYRDTEGNILGVMVIMQDITEQVVARKKVKESEARFRLMADVVPQILWTANADGFVDYYNNKWYEYTGWKDNGSGENSWAPFINPEDLPQMTECWNRSIREEVPYQFEFRLREAKTGGYRWFLSKATPVLDAEGRLIKWFGAIADIHEQKMFAEKLEQEVAERTQELQRSNEDLQQFAHVVSHDLQEPVRKIKTFASRLKTQMGEKLDEKSILFLHKMNSATDRIYAMIEGVLTYSTQNAAAQEPQPVNLHKVLQDIETDLEVIIQKSQAIIEFKDLPTLQGAPVLLYQLFYNLINNSLKFSKIGVPPRVFLSSATIFKQNDAFAKISVSDNGIGFDQEQAKNIFNAFTRLNSKDKYEGTGLGLALCKKIVARHGGTIEANGIPNEGVEFIVTLPLKQKSDVI